MHQWAQQNIKVHWLIQLQWKLYKYHKVQSKMGQKIIWKFLRGVKREVYKDVSPRVMRFFSWILTQLYNPSRLKIQSRLKKITNIMKTFQSLFMKGEKSYRKFIRFLIGKVKSKRESQSLKWVISNIKRIFYKGQSWKKV